MIFIHGRGGDRKLGANDKRFGGNFNRLKNLAVDNGGSIWRRRSGVSTPIGAGEIAG